MDPTLALIGDNASVFQFLQAMLQQNQQLPELLATGASSQEGATRVSPDTSEAIPRFTGLDGGIASNKRLNCSEQVAEL